MVNPSMDLRAQEAVKRERNLPSYRIADVPGTEQIVMGMGAVTAVLLLPPG